MSISAGVQSGAMAAGAVLATVGELRKDAVNYHNIMNKSNSLVGVGEAARVEPTTLVDSDCVSLDYITDILHSAQSLFTGYWLQALDMLSTVGGASVLSILDPINPNRDPDYAEFVQSLARKRGFESYSHMSVEAYKHALPIPGQKMLPQIGTEAIDSKAATEINAPSNLAVGKLVSVKVRNGDEIKEITIAFRLMVAEMPRETMVALVGDESQNNNSFTERFFQWRAGRITMINDLILCTDLIKERKRMIAKDKEGIYTEVRRRQSQHKQAGMLTGKASAAEASNIYVISKETADEIENRFGLEIDNFAHRTKIFANTTAIMIIVVDRDYQRVTFYHDGLRQSSNLGVADIKTSNKNGGPNVMDIFQAYKEGSVARY